MRVPRPAGILVLVVLGSIGCHSTRPAGASCPPTTDPIPAYEGDGSGSVVGAELKATLCHVGAWVYVSPDTRPPGRALLNLVYNSPSDLQIPAGGTAGWAKGSLCIDSPTPGVYLSSGSQACGSLLYVFGAPIPPGTDCDGGVPPTCSPYCSANCFGSECLPCTLDPPAVIYEADAADSGYGATQAVIGSWKIELTSVTPAVSPGAGAAFLAHGNLTANLSEGSDSAALSLAF
jgi:hypothetical protein